MRFKKNNEEIGTIELKNYGIVYNLSLIGRFGRNAKFLDSNSVLTCEVFDWGFGTINTLDYININVDYLFEISGFQPSDEFSLSFG
ncbi:MAG: hypothetical protein F6K22_33235 [Okeania sp. SIO2F4]|uniref:hypothetical protein n=1 Tax=Okeania sp. SIO2F4 TaxID=2607790 RepID=UPI00142C7DCD|nr:hypothetical protein [Okeania sp. SIO2F4]NES07232.1 hypothetical protein [Okeania sp. SIO2F4]